jgi:hydroxyacylglutathione hydrolase
VLSHALAVAHPEIVPIPCLRDNYAYLVFDPGGSGEAVVIDPSEAGPIEMEVKKRSLCLVGILNTHHHADHVGGNTELVRAFGPRVFAYRTDRDRIPKITDLVSDAVPFEVAGLSFLPRHVPGHTLGAVSYQVGQACFTGDTLFCGGCGRLFEGTPEQMHHSLTSVLAALDPQTQIYCGHEYTENNLAFAFDLFPDDAVKARLIDVRAKRAQGAFCAGAPLSLELVTNLFLRCHEPELQEVLGVRTEVDAFSELRRRKNSA